MRSPVLLPSACRPEDGCSYWRCAQGHAGADGGEVPGLSADRSASASAASEGCCRADGGAAQASLSSLSLADRRRCAKHPSRPCCCGQVAARVQHLSVCPCTTRPHSTPVFMFSAHLPSTLQHQCHCSTSFWALPAAALLIQSDSIWLFRGQTPRCTAASRCCGRSMQASKFRTHHHTLLNSTLHP